MTDPLRRESPLGREGPVGREGPLQRESPLERESPLQRGSRFIDAMRDQILATSIPPRPRPWLVRRLWAVQDRLPHRLGLLRGVGGVLAAAAVVFGLALDATAGAPPGDALVRNADGTVTLTLNDLSADIPALNARLRRMGIAETVIPVIAGCRSPAGPSFPGGPLHLNPDRMSVVFTNSVTLTARGGNRPPRGWRYIIAAKRLPDGRIAEFVGAIMVPLPSCFAP